jgi:large subunit ribosomal protein L6
MTTSRVGRKPVAIPSGVDVKIQGSDLAVKGPKGQLTLALHPFVHVALEDGHIKISPNSEGGYRRSGSGSKLNNSIAGTTRAKIQNMVMGVTSGFERKLLLVGVGYRAQAKGNTLNLSIGFSHPVTFTAPEGITIETPSQTEILIKGMDKHLVGHAASTIRAIRCPELYKGKGIRYSNEIIICKETKKK